MRIGIDLLGSDTPPEEIFPAILRAAEHAAPEITFVIFTTSTVLAELCAFSSLGNIEFHIVEEFIAMSDDPLSSIRKKKNSSLAVSMRMLKKNQLDAFITAGNTGALVGCAALYGPMFPGIKRPALLAVLPTLSNSLTIIDVGGNVSFKAENLVQFALLGTAFHHSTTAQSNIRIGLLNIGEESKKGSIELQQAYTLLKDLYGKSDQVAFIGNVEARDIFKGTFDVLVTDGFTGNILLKTSEGISSFIFDYINAQGDANMKNTASRLHGVFDHTAYPGAIVCGIDGLVIKCHGNVTEMSMYHSIQTAINFLRLDLVKKMKLSLESIQR